MLPLFNFCEFDFKSKFDCIHVIYKEYLRFCKCTLPKSRVTLTKIYISQDCLRSIFSEKFIFVDMYMLFFIKLLKTSPEYTQAGVYGKCVLHVYIKKQKQIVFIG